MHSPFLYLFEYVQLRKKRFATGLIFVFGILIFIASQIQFNADISKFIPSSSENDEFQKVLKSTNFNENIIVNLHKEPATELEVLTDFATEFLEGLNNIEHDYIAEIQGFIEDDNALEIVDFAYKNAPLFLNEKDYKTLRQRLNEDSIEAITKANYKSLISPSGIVSKDLILKDPLKISILALKNLNTIGLEGDFKLKNNFLITKDENNLLLIIRPKQNINNEALADILYGLRKKLNRDYSSEIKAEFFGGTLIASANAKQIKHDIWLTVGIALSVLMLLFMLFYKSVTIPIILFIPTVFGGLTALVFLYILRLEVSAISLGIGSVLLGVTLDYSLHILTHIRNGSNPEQLYSNISKPILMSSLTTALAFLCLLFVDSRALQDLGVFAGVSVLTASIFALLFIPHVYSSKLKPGVPFLHPSAVSGSRSSSGPDPISNSGSVLNSSSLIDKLAAFQFHRKKPLVIILIGLMVLSIFTYSKAEFNQNLSSLNYTPAELQKAERNLDAITNASSKSLYVVCYSKNRQTAMLANDSVAKILRTYKESGTLISYNSLSTFINSEKNQNAKITEWKSFWSKDKITTLRQNLVNSGNNYGFKESAFSEFYAYLNKEVVRLTIEDFQDLAAFNLNNYLSDSDDLTVITTTLKVEDKYIKLIKENFSKADNVLIIDRQAINESLLGDLRADFNNLVLYCLLAVIGILLLIYRDIKLTLVTVLPILLTWLVTIGLMGLFQLKFNIFNIIISSFIFGLGVDYSIFITNGLVSASRNYSSGLATNKTSIILSVLTTIMGVGVLIFAKHPALNSIALISIIGIVTAMLMSFTIQPILFNFIYRSQKN